jgi:glycerophosphoryl diester phosphodiesterase
MPPAVSWHRGGREFAQSATLAAFGSAAERGAEWIEVDVRRTHDGRLVCVHDRALPGIGPITDVDFDALTDDERTEVPTLEEFLAVLDDAEARSAHPTHRSGVHLDLKGTGHEVAAIEVLQASGRPYLVTTLHDESVVAVRAAAPDTPVFLTLGRSAAGLGLDGHLRLRCSEIWPYSRLRSCDATGVVVMYPLAHRRMRRWCRANGLTVLVWTIDSTAALERWLARPDVDIVTTNRPAVALRLRDRLPN